MIFRSVPDKRGFNLLGRFLTGITPNTMLAQRLSGSEFAPIGMAVRLSMSEYFFGFDR
jgi:hypothetical protein